MSIKSFLLATHARGIRTLVEVKAFSLLALMSAFLGKK
jgi:hypothetical protein